MTQPRLPRLRPGQLRDQVAAVLAADPARAFTATQLATALGGRDTHAVGNALTRLAASGNARQLPGHPPTFQHDPSSRPTTPTPTPAPAAAPTTGPAPAAGPSAAPATPPPPRPGAVRRPNGAWYLPRQLAGGTDVAVLRRLRRDAIPALLYGAPGTGKTALVEAAFADVVTVCGHGDMTVEDLLGSYVPLPDGGFEFVHGPLVVAMRTGRAFFLDDATLIPPKTLAAVYPAMDGRGVLTIEAHRNEQVSAAAGFYVVGGHNPGVHGAILSDALASRFAVHIEVTTDFELARTLGVPQPAITAAANLNTQLRNGEVDWAPQLRELLAFAQIAKTLGVRAAVANLAAIAPETDRPAVAKALRAAFGHTVDPLRLGEQA